MFLLRRSAVRALSAPSKVIAKPRSITSLAPQAFRSKQQQWMWTGFQKRYLNDEAENRGATSTPDSFAQTAAEAPVDETITPAAPKADPTDPTATVDAAALEAAAEGRTQGRPRSQNPSSNTLYVGNLFYEVTEEQLQRVFSRFGNVSKVNIVQDNRGLSRGFAYVEFENQPDAEAAVENLDMQVFEGRNLVVQFHRPRQPRGGASRSGPNNTKPGTPSKTLFIGNMSFDMSDKDLSQLFNNIRNVMDVRVAIDRRTGQPRGFAHADFVDVASATQAMEELKDKVVHGRTLRIDYSTSSTQSPRRRAFGDKDLQ